MNEQEMMQLLYEVFDPSMPRLGPGDDAATTKALQVALSAVRATPESTPRILDLGCGNGAQTIQLAKHANGTILAIDNHQPYLDELQRRADIAGVSEKITALLGDMAALSLNETFDVIWSEGALYCMGFRNGLSVCRRLLKPNGCLAVTEMCWLKPDPPEECRRYVEEVYPDILDIKANLAAMRDCGYTILDNFTLPDSAWEDRYYTPLQARVNAYRRQFAKDAGRMQFADTLQREIDIFETYHDYYGYVFYVMQSCANK